MLPARHRMTRSVDFGATVRSGVRAAQPNLVIHELRARGTGVDDPKIGLVVGKSVGNAVERHRVARKLRHVARAVVGDLRAGDRMVIRALPGSRCARSERLEHELRSALEQSERRHAQRGAEASR